MSTLPSDDELAREKGQILDDLCADEPVRDLGFVGIVESGRRDLSERVEELLYGRASAPTRLPPAPAIRRRRR